MLGIVLKIAFLVIPTLTDINSIPFVPCVRNERNSWVCIVNLEPRCVVWRASFSPNNPLSVIFHLIFYFLHLCTSAPLHGPILRGKAKV